MVLISAKDPQLLKIIPIWDLILDTGKTIKTSNFKKK
jgi:hypothetical protein